MTPPGARRINWDVLSRLPWRLAAVALVGALAPPALAAAPSATAEPPQVVLGTGAQVTLTVHTDGQSEHLEALTTVGSLSPREILSPGEARYRWSPPPTRFPQVALVLFWVPRPDAAPDVAVLRLPLVGQTDLDVDTAPRTQVQVEVAGRLFGPVLADPKGKARVPIEVPPGVAEARVLGHTGGRSTSITVPLSPPPVNPLAAVISPAPLSPGQRGWLWILHASRLDPSRLVLSVRGGQATLERTGPDRALYALASSPGAKALTADISLRGDPAAKARASVRIAEPPHPPKRVEPPPPKEVEPILPKKIEPPPPPKIEPPPPPSAGLLDRLSPAASAGIFIGGAANHGPGFSVGAGYRLPWLRERLSAEAELGLRSQQATIPAGTDGTFHSSLLIVPVEVALRARLLQRGRWSLDGRLGGGLLPFQHTVSADFQPGFSEGGIGAEAFAAAQVAWRIAPFELFLELRGAYSPATTGQLVAFPGGLLVSLGARYGVH